MSKNLLSRVITNAVCSAVNTIVRDCVKTGLKKLEGEPEHKKTTRRTTTSKRRVREEDYDEVDTKF